MSESIDELRSRWESDPTPNISLQLAEEYRRLDRRQEAVEVLTRVLDEHPNHMASRVAMGRYRLEMGDTEEARRLLEQVVAEDPTHLVAGKLLVKLYIEIGDKKQAQDRLDLYKLLNEGDPEVEDLEQRLAGERAPVTAGLQRRAVKLDVPRNGDPFGDLFSGTTAREYWQAIAAEGIFPVPATGVPSPETAVKESSSPVADEPAPPDAPPGATVTLANLYLQQGHIDDAETAFAEVLEREPENREARSGLEEVKRRRAAEMGGDYPDDEPRAAVAADVNSRKVEVLREYLARLRDAANRN